MIAAGKRLRLWHTSCGPLVPSPPLSLTVSVTQTHAKQATVSTASYIQLQMSSLWAPVLFDVMNNENEFSFTQVFENKQSGLWAPESTHFQVTCIHRLIVNFCYRGFQNSLCHHVKHSSEADMWTSRQWWISDKVDLKWCLTCWRTYQKNMKLKAHK